MPKGFWQITGRRRARVCTSRVALASMLASEAETSKAESMRQRRAASRPVLRALPPAQLAALCQAAFEPVPVGRFRRGRADFLERCGGGGLEQQLPETKHLTRAE